MKWWIRQNTKLVAIAIIHHFTIQIKINVNRKWRKFRIYLIKVIVCRNILFGIFNKFLYECFKGANSYTIYFIWKRCNAIRYDSMRPSYVGSRSPCTRNRRGNRRHWKIKIKRSKCDHDRCPSNNLYMYTYCIFYLKRFLLFVKFKAVSENVKS